MLWEPIDHSKGFYFRVVNLSVTYGKLHVPSVDNTSNFASPDEFDDVEGIFEIVK